MQRGERYTGGGLNNDEEDRKGEGHHGEKVKGVVVVEGVVLIKKVCCSQESDCGTFAYNSTCGVEGGIWS